VVATADIPARESFIQRGEKRKKNQTAWGKKRETGSVFTPPGLHSSRRKSQCRPSACCEEKEVLEMEGRTPAAGKNQGKNRLCNTEDEKSKKGPDRRSAAVGDT